MNNGIKICDVEIERVHAALLDLLFEFDRICRKNNIQYSAEGGTLLGAVKYGGFVPWDDDVDVVMLRDDYERFIKACESELSGRFFLQCTATDPQFPLSYAKLRLCDSSYVQKNYEHLDINHGVFMDITPLDYVDKKISRFQIARIGIYNGAKGYKLGLIGGRLRRNQKFPLAKTCLYKLASILPLRVLNKRIRALQISKKPTEYVYNLTNPLRGVAPTSVHEFDEFVDLDFAGMKIMAIKNYEQMLGRLFGNNYMNEEPDPLTRGPSHAITDCRLPHESNTAKVGVMTYHSADNYGAVLQAYALCRAVRREVGVDCEIIDYKYPVTEEFCRNNEDKRRRANKWRQKDREHFSAFRRSYLPMGSSCGPESLAGVAASYHAVINGLERSCYTHFEKPCLISMDKLCLDPVLLLESQDYGRLETELNPVACRYILVYLDRADELAFDFARRLSARSGDRIVYINTAGQTVKGIDNLREVPVGHFLKLIKNASAVVTSSYYGVAFSALYNTEVYYQSSSADSLFGFDVNVLAQNLGLSGRSIADVTDATVPIDWNLVNERVSLLRQKTVDFLREELLR